MLHTGRYSCANDFALNGTYHNFCDRTCSICPPRTVTPTPAPSSPPSSRASSELPLTSAPACSTAVRGQVSRWLGAAADAADPLKQNPQLQQCVSLSKQAETAGQRPAAFVALIGICSCLAPADSPANLRMLSDLDDWSDAQAAWMLACKPDRYSEYNLYQRLVQCNAAPAVHCGSFDAVNAACPDSSTSDGGLIPASCPAECAAVFLPWWTLCKTGEGNGESLVDATLANQLESFAAVCADGPEHHR